MELTFTTFDIEDCGSDCRCDGLYISGLLAPLCGHSLPDGDGVVKSKVRSGHVRVFSVHIQSKLSRAQVPDFAGSSVRDIKKGGGSKGGPPALEGTREYEQSDRNR